MPLPDGVLHWHLLKQVRKSWIEDFVPDMGAGAEARCLDRCLVHGTAFGSKNTQHSLTDTSEPTG
jgi:hypothetical protein